MHFVVYIVHVHTQVAELQVTYLLYLVDTCLVRVQIDCREVV
jgi:hypothetical protein